MATNKLTHKQCEEATLKPGSKITRFADGEGLILQITKRGDGFVKYWRYSYRHNGLRKTRGFGTFPQVSLAKARQLRKEAQEVLEQGIDPVQYDRDQREAQILEKQQEAIDTGMTFECVAYRMCEAKTGKVTEETQKKIYRQLQLHLFDSIGKKPIKDITGRELLALFREIAEKTNHKRKLTYMARKLCQWTSEVFEHAKLEDDTFDRNPCANMVRALPQHEEKHMRKIGRERLGEFLHQLGEYEGYKTTKAAIWMMLYTGVRQASVRFAKWEDFDLKAKIWHRRPEKTDKESWAIPLPDQAVKLLEEVHEVTEGKPNDWVFPTPLKHMNQLSENAVGQAIRRMKFSEYMVGHGLRGLVTSELNELGFPSRYVETQVGHKLKNQVEAAYNTAKLLDQRRVMMQFFADYLDALRAAAETLADMQRDKGKKIINLKKLSLEEAKQKALKKNPKAKEMRQYQKKHQFSLGGAPCEPVGGVG